MTYHKDTAVLTTKGVFFENMPISYIFHYAKDGMWEFRENKNFLLDSEILIVSLAEVIRKDVALGDMLYIPLGYYAFRIDVDCQWVVKPI